GQMSLVGPRPEDPVYVDLDVAAQRIALGVRPGVTSPASLRYRDEEELLVGADWERTYREQVLPDKVAVDVAYLSTATLGSYVSVLAQTACAVLPLPHLPHRTRPVRQPLESP
ncbi:MAG: sugar transferase, partial [Pseudorhodobacter sp.]|nr:sugar transferase [Frankiaceae bacterium]